MPFTLVPLDPGQELAVGIGVAPGVGLEPPALHGLHFRARYTAITFGVLVLGENITAVVLGGVAVLLAGGADASSLCRV